MNTEQEYQQKIDELHQIIEREAQRAKAILQGLGDKLARVEVGNAIDFSPEIGKLKQMAQLLDEALPSPTNEPVEAAILPPALDPSNFENARSVEALKPVIGPKLYTGPVPEELKDTQVGEATPRVLEGATPGSTEPIPAEAPEQHPLSEDAEPRQPIKEQAPPEPDTSSDMSGVGIATEVKTTRKRQSII